MKDQHSSRNCVLGHRVYGIPFQESYLKDLWWALMQAASHFLFRKDRSQPGEMGSLSLGHTALCLASVSQRSSQVLLHTLSFLFHLCLVFFSPSRESTSYREVVRLMQITFFSWNMCLCCVEKKNKEAWWERLFLFSQPSSSSPNMKSHQLVWSLWGQTWTNVKHTGTVSPNQIISVCNSVTIGMRVSITRDSHGWALKQFKVQGKVWT